MAKMLFPQCFGNQFLSLSVSLIVCLGQRWSILGVYGRTGHFPLPAVSDFCCRMRSSPNVRRQDASEAFQDARPKLLPGKPRRMCAVGQPRQTANPPNCPATAKKPPQNTASTWTSLLYILQSLICETFCYHHCFCLLYCWSASSNKPPKRPGTTKKPPRNGAWTWKFSLNGIWLLISIKKSCIWDKCCHYPHCVLF